MKRFATILALVVAVAAQSASAQTLKAVKDRGMLNCGANGTLAGFGLPDAQGKWTGLDVDFCRAHRCRGLERCRQGQIRTVVGQGPLYRLAVG